jgi:hypothetical protein
MNGDVCMQTRPKFLLFAILILWATVQPTVQASDPGSVSGVQAPVPTTAILIVDDFDRSHDLTFDHAQFKTLDEQLQSAISTNNVTNILEAIQAGQAVPFEDYPEELRGLSESDACALNLPSLVTDGQGNYIKGGLSDSTLLYPHGYYVADTAREAVRLLPNAASIEVVNVDTNSYETRSIYNEILNTKESLKSAGVQSFVINMSFAYIPCDPQLISVLAYYDMVVGRVNEARQNGTLAEQDAIAIFQSVLNELVTTMNEPANQEDLLQRFANCNYLEPLPDAEGKEYNSVVPDNCDPLQRLAGSNVIAVAASGNLGDKYTNPDPRLNAIGMYPLAPALWSSVVSVGALDPTSTSDQRASWSNAGEVLMNGYVVDPVTGDTLRGTSFAAPRLSAVLANYLVEQGNIDICNKVGLPALAYIPQEDWLSQYFPPVTPLNIKDVNLGLQTAITNYCEFVRP